MTLFDTLHLIFHFLVIGCYLYLLLVVFNKYKHVLKKHIFWFIIIVCFTMIYNLLHQATQGDFIFGKITIYKLTKLPFWIITNGVNAYVLWYFLSEKLNRKEL